MSIRARRSGYLAGRLGELGRGARRLRRGDRPGAWNDTVVVVISEFGRTFRENGDRGTDHGHGSVYWVMGGGVKAAGSPGEQVKVDQANLFQNRDYPVLTDYRSLFGGLFQRIYGLQPPVSSAFSPRPSRPISESSRRAAQARWCGVRNSCLRRHAR